MDKEELEEFLEMVQQDAFIDEYGWGQPEPSLEYRKKWYKRFDELQDKLYTAIKDYQLHKEILNDYGFTLANFREACLVLAQFRGIGFTGIENKLKALEIIKKKEVNIQELFDFIKKYGEHNGLYMYNGYRPYEKRINEEEFNLLKETFKYERL